MLSALRDAGWRDYTLHLRGDGLLVGIVHADDLAAAQAAVDATEVNARWQQEMAPFFADLPSGRPDRGFRLLETVFDLDAQLDARLDAHRDDLPAATAGKTGAQE